MYVFMHAASHLNWENRQQQVKSQHIGAVVDLKHKQTKLNAHMNLCAETNKNALYGSEKLLTQKHNRSMHERFKTIHNYSFPTPCTSAPDVAFHV